MPLYAHPSLAALLALAPLLAGCGGSTPLLESTPAPDPPDALQVDGEIGDWDGGLRTVGDAPLLLGARNDGEALYLAAVIREPEALRHVLLTGLVVWLDAEGGRREALGIHYPLGLVRDGRLPDPSVLRGTDRSDAARAERLEAMLDELALVRDGEATLHPRGTVPGLETAASLETGMLVLELRVPLRAAAPEAPFALAAGSGAEVGVGLETPALDRAALRAQFRERAARRRGGAGRLRGQRGGGDRARPTPPEPVETWVRLTLAE